ncbi:hypothetical protein HYN59_06400 [Flavobacterium album]|uniref:VCBS repeat-containing protein n=1 Tax=Flavobacterium album TaxID=2175091 RepID=A0A2S1QWJ2_9FLAO|nr:hypothetical protein [Flavobacterium album]AWH84776.1 hypothetical protein HYN59_06400 [Flavobacterium album]
MKEGLFTLLLAFSLASCKKEKSTDTIATPPAITAVPTQPISRPVNDYDGDGIADEAEVILVKEGEGNPVEDDTPSEYAIAFNNKKFAQLPIGCCEATIIPEGDLDGDGAAELSVFQSPMNGCVHTMTTYTFRNGKWQKLFRPFLVPTGCDEISKEELEKLVYKENGKVYIMETDVNDEDFKKNPIDVKL